MGAVKLLTNYYVASEVLAVLKRREFNLTEEELEGMMKYLHLCVAVVDDPSGEEVLSNLGLLRDKKDIPMALGALSTQSDYLVTGDKELLKAPRISSITTSGLLQLIYNDQPDGVPCDQPS